MLKSICSAKIFGVLFLSVALLFGSVSTDAFGAEKDATKQVTDKWQSVMRFYAMNRAERLLPFLIDSNADDMAILVADYYTFLDTFEFISKVGGWEYDVMIKEQVTLLVANRAKMSDPLFQKEQTDSFEKKYEKIFGKAKNPIEREARTMLIGGDTTFRYIDAIYGFDTPAARKAKLFTTLALRPPVSVSRKSIGPPARSY